MPSPNLQHPAIRPWRLFGSGGSALSLPAARFWEELGYLLADQKGLIVLTGGLRRVRNVPPPEPPTADWSIVNGMLRRLQELGADPDNHIETVLPDPRHEYDKLDRFNIGRILTIPNRTPQSRRFTLANSADVIISIEGETGTRSVLDMALAIDKPIFPVPFAVPAREKVSWSRWEAHREQILDWFQIDAAEADELERIKLEQLAPEEVKTLASRIRDHLMKGFTRNCFIIMSFKPELDHIYDDAIKPVLAAHGLKAVRTDKLGLTGNVVECIHRAIRNCQFAIAEISGDSPNVMYELGMAHAEHKPVILLRQMAPDGSLPRLPFDIQTENVVKYRANETAGLRDMLSRTVAVLLGKADGIDSMT